MTKYSKCLVCDSPMLPAKLQGLLRCEHCQFVTADMNLSKEDLQNLYATNYFQGGEYVDYLAEEPSLTHNFFRRLDTLLRLLPKHQAYNLFEVGCAFGFFLDLARPYFSNVAGCDISKAAISHARKMYKLNVYEDEFTAIKNSPTYDLICMWDTIEHIKHPDQYVSHAANILSENGLIALTTGNIGSLNAKFRGPRWRMIHPPTHLHYFNKKSMFHLLERHNFEVIHFEHPSVARSIQFILGKVIPDGRIKDFIMEQLTRTGLADFKLSINLFDIMYVIARKVR